MKPVTYLKHSYFSHCNLLDERVIFWLDEFLDGHYWARLPVSTFEHNAIGPLSYLTQLFIFVHHWKCGLFYSDTARQHRTADWRFRCYDLRGFRGKHRTSTKLIGEVCKARLCPMMADWCFHLMAAYQEGRVLKGIHPYGDTRHHCVQNDRLSMDAANVNKQTTK